MILIWTTALVVGKIFTTDIARGVSTGLCNNGLTDSNWGGKGYLSLSLLRIAEYFN